MSISTFQEKLKGGCGLAVLGVCAAIMLGGVFYTSCVTTRMGGGTSDQDSHPVAVEVAGTPIYADDITQNVAGQKAYQSQYMPGSMTPEAELGIYEKAVQDAVDQASQAAIVQSSGIPLTDDALIKAYNDSVQRQIEGLRGQLVASGKLKPNATDEDFDKAFKEESGGRTLAVATKDMLDQFKKALADKEKRNGAVLGLSMVLLQNQAAEKLALSDEDLKRNYDQYTVKRIIAKDIVPGNKKPEERIAKAQAALKAGSTFEKAIDDFSEDLPTGGKKLSESTSTITGYTMLTDPVFKPLLALKAGDVSDIVKTPDGLAIYKVVAIKHDLPKDFDKRKEFYRDQVVHEMTQKDVDAKIESFKSKPGNIKFVSPSYKLIYDYQQAQSGAADPSGKSLLDQMKSIDEQAKKLTDEASGADVRPATLVRYGAASFLYNTPGADLTKIRPEMIDALKGILDRSEVFSVRMKLVDVYVDGKQYDLAVNQLVSAAQNNRPDMSGTINNSQITEKLKKLVDAKQITADQQKQVEDAQKAWQVQADETRKQQEEVAKERAAARAAEKAAEDKAKKDAEKKTPAGSTPPASPPADGTKPPADASIPGTKK